MRGDRVHELATIGFGRSVDEYERARPGYPPEGVAWLVERLAITSSNTVLDLAAGTGKLTRQLLPTGAAIVAVEPIAEMRARLERELPGVDTLDGTAEDIPLPDSAVDAVAVGQAFHWFANARALAEIHRVLRPGRRLGLIWNARDESVDWVARLSDIVEPHRGDVPRYVSRRWERAFATATLFGPLEERQFPFAHELDAERLVARVASISFVAALAPDERERVLRDVRELAATHPELRGKATFPLPYRTAVFVAERLG
ncbi:MAG TPA: methyltransferase domain-containing protein [Gaiellaceae bacterium]|nr:methyltransferase domain-containing protein [Gaiellaceae bacterium]